MWRMTRDLEKKSLKFHKEHVPRKFLEIEEQKFVVANYIQDFAVRKRKSDQQALNLLESCEKEGYIDVLPRGKVSVLRVNQDRGTDLTDNILRFPTGLIEALWEKHGKIFTGIIGFLLGLIPTIVWLINHI